uniref:PIPK domain-containing protein n=1 Tax=Macrostomum lignano TaxID=282301 RepID=A0A1I8FIH2_9PLAT
VIVTDFLSLLKEPAQNGYIQYRPSGLRRHDRIDRISIVESLQFLLWAFQFSHQRRQACLSLQPLLVARLAMASPCTSLESDFDQSLASCFGLCWAAASPGDTIASTVKLTAFKDCQDGILNNSSQHWSGCPWWAAEEYKKKLVLRGQMLSSYLASGLQNDVAAKSPRPGQQLPAQQRVPGLPERSDQQRLRPPQRTSSSRAVAARMLGQRDCQGRYNFAWPELREPRAACHTNFHPILLRQLSNSTAAAPATFKLKVRTNEDLFRVRTDFMMTGALPIVRSGRKFSLQKGPEWLCDAVHDYENGLDSINNVCPRGYNLLRALFEMEARFYQMKFICLNLNDAALSQCDQHTNEARGLLFHRLEMQCTDYSKTQNPGSSGCVGRREPVPGDGDVAPVRRQGRQLFGALVRMRNTLQRFEIDCQGAYVSNNYTVEQFLIRPEAERRSRQLLTPSTLLNEGGSSRLAGSSSSSSRRRDNPETDPAKRMAGEPRRSRWLWRHCRRGCDLLAGLGSHAVFRSTCETRMVEVCGHSLPLRSRRQGRTTFGVNSNVHSFVDKVYNGFEVFLNKISRCQCRRACNDLVCEVHSKQPNAAYQPNSARHQGALIAGHSVFIKGDSGPVQQPRSALAPSTPFGRRSTSNRWQSVPPVTTLWPLAISARLIACALARTWGMQGHPAPRTKGSTKVKPNLLGVSFELWRASLQRHGGDAGNSSFVRAALQAGEHGEVDSLLKVVLRRRRPFAAAIENDAGARAAQRLVRGAGDNVGKFEWRRITPAATRPLMWAMSAIRTAPSSSQRRRKRA